MLYLVTGWFRQQHRPSPTGYASEPQDQHALQQQQCMPRHRASHGGLGLARSSSGLKGPKHWMDTPGKDREEEIIHDSLFYFIPRVYLLSKAVLQLATRRRRWRVAINPSRNCYGSAELVLPNDTQTPFHLHPLTSSAWIRSGSALPHAAHDFVLKHLKTMWPLCLLLSPPAEKWGMDKRGRTCAPNARPCVSHYSDPICFFRACAADKRGRRHPAHRGIIKSYSGCKSEMFF